MKSRLIDSFVPLGNYQGDAEPSTPQARVFVDAIKHLTQKYSVRVLPGVPSILEVKLNETTVCRPPPQLFKVECRFIYGWDDAGWTETAPGSDVAVPQRFTSREEAQAAIDELVADTAEAARDGFMSDAYSAADYRVVPAELTGVVELK